MSDADEEESEAGDRIHFSFISIDDVNKEISQSPKDSILTLLDQPVSTATPSDFSPSVLGLNSLNSSPTSARLRGLARPPALLPISLASHQANLNTKVDIRINGVTEKDPMEGEGESTPRYSRFSASTRVDSPTSSIAPTLVGNSNPNTPTTPHAPLTPNYHVQPLPTVDEKENQFNHSRRPSKKSHRIAKEDQKGDNGEEEDLQGAFKKSFLLDVGNGRNVPMMSLPTPSLEKGDPFSRGNWL